MALLGRSCSNGPGSEYSCMHEAQQWNGDDKLKLYLDDGHDIMMSESKGFKRRNNRAISYS